MRPAVQL